MTFSIRQKIILFTVVPVTLIYNIIFLVTLYQNMGSETNYIENRLTDSVGANAAQLDIHLRDAVLLAENAAALMTTLGDIDSVERQDINRALLTSNDVLEGMGVLRRIDEQHYQMSFVWRTSRKWVQYPDGSMLLGLDKWLKPWMESGREEGWSPLLDLANDGKDVGYVYTKRYRANGVEGASLVYLPLEIVRRQWLPASGVNPRLLLLNEDKEVIYTSDNIGPGIRNLPPEVLKDYVQKVYEKMESSGKSLLETRFGKQHVVICRQLLSSANWTLVGAVPKDEVISVVRERVMLQALIMLASLAAIFISVWFISGRIVRPLRILDKAMGRVAEGQLNTEVDISGEDEASLLAKRFSVMTRQLVLREQREWDARTTSFDHIVQALSGEFFYFSHDLDGNVTYASPSVENAIGVPAEAFKSHYTRFYTDSPMNEQGRQVTQQVIEGASSGLYEVEMQNHKGGIYFVEIVKVPVLDFDGNVIRIECMGRNVTSRANDVARFRGLLESAPDAMVITDADGHITMVNARTEALFGFMRSSLVGRQVSCLFPEEESQSFPLLNVSPEERVKLRIRSGFELRARKRSGKTLPVEITLSPIETPDGVLTSISMRDVSDRHAAEQALRTSEERYRRMIEALQQEYIFYTQRVDGSFMYMTDSVTRILGYTPDDFMVNSLQYLRSGEDRERSRKVREQICKGKTHPSYELEVIKPDGSIGVIEVLDTPAFNDRGQVTVIEGLVRDRTRERAAATALSEARDAAEAANEAKTLFLSNMSHELRTPLNGVLGYVQLLLGDMDVTPVQHDRLVAIQACGQHLLTLINDILDLTKAESGKMDLQSKPVSIPVLVDTVEQILYQKAEMKGLALELFICTEVPALVMGDEIKMRQILINLVSNAIKFTDRGRVRLKVSALNAGLAFEVEDTGIGISQEQIEHIFDPFRQGDGGRKEGGTGLGLSISRRLASAMGGDLNVTSKPGKGSRFLFTMPLQTVHEVSGSEDLLDIYMGDGHLAPGQDVRVLVVDDTETNCDILKQMLEAAGFGVVCVSNGRQAVDAAGREHFDLVLMDLRMPVMSGFRAVRMMHSRHGREHLPVIAISAGVYPSLVDDIRRWGFADFIGKPFRSKELFRVIRRHLQLVWKDSMNKDKGASEVPADIEVTISSAVAEALAEVFGDAVDMGDVEAVQRIARSLLDDSGKGFSHTLADEDIQGAQHWARRALRCCDALALEELEQMLEQLRAHA